MDFKYKKKVTITLQSNSKPDLERIANKYFSPKINDNKVDDENRFVAINATKEVLK